jgi:hypothetical protein
MCAPAPPNEDDAVGHLVHKPGGAEHAQWMFEYNGAAADEETGYRFGAHGPVNMYRSGTQTASFTPSW